MDIKIAFISVIQIRKRLHEIFFLDKLLKLQK